MSSTVHPMIKLADESIQKIDRQLDCSSLYFNSKSLKTSMNSKKKRGIKIGNKITYILGPGAQILTPTSNLGFSSKVLKASKVVIEDVTSDRNSDATTVKEVSKDGSGEKPTSGNSGTQKKKNSKKKSDKILYLSSPPLSNLDRRSKKNLNKLMAEFGNSSGDKLFCSNQNLQNSLGSFREDASKSMKEEDLELIKSNKLSVFNTEDGSNQHNDVIIEIKAKYELEIKSLKDKLDNAENREIDMQNKFNKLEKDFKDFGLEELIRTIHKGKFKNLEEYINHLIVIKYKSSQEELEDSNCISDDKHPHNSDNKGIIKCIEELINEIFKFRQAIEHQATEIDYLRQKESKLMYLFYLLHRKGIDVNTVYETELKDVPTERFNEWIKNKMGEDEQPPDISFESQASYSPICDGPMPKPIKPICVPTLNLDTIPDYITSSDEGENDESSLHCLMNKSLDGSKLHRKSEVVSDASILHNDMDPSHLKFKEDYLLIQKLK